MGCIPVLDRGCFGCCKLSSCVKALAIFNIVGSFFTIATCASQLYSLDSLPDDINISPPMQKIITDTRIAYGAIIAASIAYFIIEILLLRGAQTGNRALVLPHLIVSSVLVLAVVCYSFDDFKHAIDVGPVVFRIVWTAAVQLYFLLNVYSLYVQLGTPTRTNYATVHDKKESLASFA